MRVLVVDDDPSIVNILSFSMKKSCYQVDDATNGINTVELLLNNLYDAAIIDAIVPKMNGAEVCKFMKALYLSILISSV
jgi:two-component system alkaline phosphatase synthesis response regulator PhoP